VLTAKPAEYLAMQKASQRIVAAHDLKKTVDTFEALYRGESVTDPVTEPVPESKKRMT